jgi:hypothetical protein
VQEEDYDGFHLDQYETGYTEDSTTVIENLTIKGAKYGILMNNTAPYLQNLKITECHASGIYGVVANLHSSEVYNNAVGVTVDYYQSASRIYDCDIHDNVEKGLNISRSTEIRRTAFENNGNYGFYGELESAPVFIDSCIFEDETCAVNVRSIQVHGSSFTSCGNGVLTNHYSGHGRSYSNVSECSFLGLSGTAVGGATWGRVSHCTFRHNTGEIMSVWGSESFDSHGEMYACVIDSNDAGINAGGVSSFSMANCLYINNSKSVHVSSGSAISFSASISACTFAYNNCDAIVAGYLFGPEMDKLSIANNIVALNNGGGIVFPGYDNSYKIVCCDVYGNTSGNYVGSVDRTDYSGNISADPLFCDAPGGDYSLFIGSPCLPANNSCGYQIGAYGMGCEIAVCDFGITPLKYIERRGLLDPHDTLGLRSLEIVPYSFDLSLTFCTRVDFQIGDSAEVTVNDIHCPAVVTATGGTSVRSIIVTAYVEGLNPVESPVAIYTIDGKPINDELGKPIDYLLLTIPDPAEAIIISGSDGDCDCRGFCDLDGSGTITPVDVVILTNYVYRSQDSRSGIPVSCPISQGDWDCNGRITPLDVTYSVNFIYKQVGSGPCNPCDGLP